MTKVHRKCQKGGSCHPSRCKCCKKISVLVDCVCYLKKRRKPRLKKKKCSRVKTSERAFKNIITQDEWISLPSQRTSKLTTYSYAIVNRGSHAANIKIQVSPDAKNFADDNQITVEGGKTGVIVPMRYLFFTRITVQSNNPGESSKLDIYFQGQSTG